MTGMSRENPTTWVSPKPSREVDRVGRDIKRALPADIPARVELSIDAARKLITLYAIVVDKQHRGAGYGSDAMRALCSWADENEYTVALTPDSSLGATSAPRLVRFYKRFGFVENKGRKADFEISAGMYRYPRTPR